MAENGAMVETTSREVEQEIDEVVKQFFNRHRDELHTYGDAMGFLHNADYEDLRQEAGSIGQSQFSTEIIWLTGMFGPQAEIDFDALKPKHRKLKPDYIPPEPEEPKAEEKPKAKRGRKKSKKSGPTNALGEVVAAAKEPQESPKIEEQEQDAVEQPKPQPKRPKRRGRGMRVPPGALGEE